MSEIVVVGAAILDVLAQPVSEKVFQTGSIPVDDIRMSTGGDGLNEATVLSRFGKKVQLDTLLGEDEPGQLVKNHCQRCGISFGESVIQKEIPTGVNIVLVQEDGSRNFLTNPGSSLRSLSLEHIRIPFPDETRILSFASIFVFPKLKNMELSEIFSVAKAQDMIICADVTKPKNNETLKDIGEALSYVDYLFPNYEEAMMVTGKENLNEIADDFLETGLRNIVIKCGAKGCFVKNAEQCFHMPAMANVNCIDTTGAGDCFAAGFIYGISEGHTLEECARFANACGGLAVENLGATTGIQGLSQVLDRMQQE